MSLALGFETYPYYAQVALFDPGVPDSYPEWVTGDEEAVFGPGGIVVATRADDSEKVRIEVWFGPYAPGASWRFVEDGVLQVSALKLVVGSVTGSDLREVTVNSGWHRVSVYVHDGDGGPDAVVFAIEDPNRGAVESSAR